MITLLDIPGLRALATREPAFPRALVDLASQLDLDPNRLIAVMSLESGLNPQATNPQGNATGLIQFMPQTAKILGTTVDMLRRMSAVEQLEYVRRYFAPHAARMSKTSSADHYMAVFMPAYIGFPPETVLGVKDSAEILPRTNLTKGTIYSQNASLDADRDGKITIADLARKVDSRIVSAKMKPGLELPDVPLAPRPASPSASPSLPPPWVSSGARFDLPVLRIGAKGTAVTLAQLLLGSEVTGVYTDAMARDFVRPFQRGQNLEDDAVIGPKTWMLLGVHLKERPTEPPPG